MNQKIKIALKIIATLLVILLVVRSVKTISWALNKLDKTDSIKSK